MQLSSEHHSSTIQSLILFGQQVFHLNRDFYVSWLSSYQWIVSYHPFLRLICGRDRNAGCKFVYESFDLEQTGVPNSFCLLNWPLQENINTHSHTYTHNWHKDTQPHTNRDTQFQNGVAQLSVYLSSITDFDTYTYTVRLFGFFFHFFLCRRQK